MNRLRTLCLLSLIFASVELFADSLTVATQLSAGGSITSTDCPLAAAGAFTTSGGLVRVGCSGYVSTAPITLSASASGDLSKGIFGAFSYAAKPEVVAANTGTATAAVLVAYHFNISGGPASGIIAIRANVDGALSLSLPNCAIAPGQPASLASPGCNSYVIGQIHMASGSIQGNTTGVQNLQDGNSSLVFLVPFDTSGGDLAFRIDAFSQCSGFGIPLDGVGFFGCESIADFGHTIGISSATVSDESGHVVNGISVVSDSGFNPNSTPTNTPEPSTLVLAGSGAVVWWSRHARLLHKLVSALCGEGSRAT